MSQRAEVLLPRPAFLDATMPERVEALLFVANRGLDARLIPVEQKIVAPLLGLASWLSALGPIESVHL